jgi:hypothetical protein
VPSGATCTLEGTRVKGTIKVESNARLAATSVNVIGNVQAENFRSVKLTGSTVGGSVQLVQGGSATIRHNQIEGTLLFDDNSGSLIAANNTINADLQAFQNTGGVTATCSARRTSPHPPVAATSCRATRRTSAPGCDLRQLEPLP